MSSFRIWNVQSAVTCESWRVPSPKSVYFGISNPILYFPHNFHVPSILLFTVYFHVPCTVHFTVYFHTVTSMFLFLCYWSHSKGNAVNQTIQLCFYQRFVQNVISTLIWNCATSQRHINLKTTLKRRWNVCWVVIIVKAGLSPSKEIDLLGKMFLVLLYSINWPNFIAWLFLHLEILVNMCTGILC